MLSETNEEELLSNIDLEEQSARYRDPAWQELEIDSFPDCYQDSPFLNKLKAQAESGDREVLISDIDWTFYHQDNPEESQELYSLLERAGIPLCYCTGRDLDRVIDQGDLPKADLILSAVGTEIWVRQADGSYLIDENYSEMLRKNWRRKEIYDIIRGLIDEEGKKLEFQQRDRTEAEDSREVQEFKISLYFYGDSTGAEKMQDKISQLLGDDIGVIISTNWRQEDCFFIDIVPKYEGKTGKAMPIHYLKALSGGFRSIAAGDGGNDSDMLFSSDSQAIVVGNYLPEMPALVKKLEEAQENWRDNLTGYRHEGQYHDVYVADQEDVGPRAISKALIRGDFNPHFAKVLAKCLK